jgi:hypothetical protein
METTRAGMTVGEAVALVNEAIKKLEVGPERVTAVDPAQVDVDWDWGQRPSSARCMKMLAVASRVDTELSDYRHQMPEVLLVADDGAVTGFFGNLVRIMTGPVSRG